MKKCLPIVLMVIVMLLVYVNCLEFPGMTNIEFTYFPLHIGNMCTTSGVTFCRTDRLLPYIPEDPAYFSYYLDASPQAGVPVDRTERVLEQTFSWLVERAIDSVVVVSGSVEFFREKWILIEENSGDWTCTWSDEPLW
ncbi:MAG: hypothetical protein OEV79_12500 [candidate division WOR-3 bacterium]|nr:hypothetical protein [candidate division WOR-3 bacterium]